MKIIVDTCVWSKALRKSPQERDEKFVELIKSGIVVLIGPIRQEILSGIKSETQFNLLKTKLAPFEDIAIGTDDYIQAAKYFNICRSKGVQGSMIDFLITAIAHNHQLKIYTYDKDFDHYQKVIKFDVLYR